ncbi:U-box domain-containing protein 33-like isoform X2 [Impatiens glandulifera]|uniref:U-box domain-containing protein 33-like isoform X2 n=1 Tax=Impatiens glandulifera TaxID=253017 RepID=UPI001FB09576|nr:U-box domain-containing protein 33-like isoform X2 [Impatiens glandulifera]
MEIVVEPMVEEDTVYVALGKNLNDGKSILEWALQYQRGNYICILHVHQPAQRIPFLGTKFLVSQLDEKHVKAHREEEKKEMNKLLDNYRSICGRAGVLAKVLHTENDAVEKGIVDLISQYAIRKLLMGGKISRNTRELKSKKAIYVQLEAPIYCHIWFIRKGQLVHSREGRLSGIGMDSAPLSLQASPSAQTGIGVSASSLSSRGWKNRLISSPDYSRIWSNIHGTGIGLSPVDCAEGATPRSLSQHSSSSSGRSTRTIPSRSCSSTSSCASASPREMIDYAIQASPESDTIYDLKDQLAQAMEEAEKIRQEALEESGRCKKAERESIQANHQVKTLEGRHSEQLRKRKDIEEAILKSKEELGKMKLQLDKITEEHNIAMEKKSSLESELTGCEITVDDIEKDLFSAVDLLTKYEVERDELKVERDDAIREAQELRKLQPEVSGFFYEFSFSEIEEATRNFDPSLKIAEGGYGTIYKCFLCHTQVAVKVMNSMSLQGPDEFQQEVSILSKLKHPNLVNLIGACPEIYTLVYEYIPNGSLEDRLMCNDNTPPLTWQTRIRIAAELCSVIIFLQSCHPNAIVHGDIKPANIMLDANYISKLGDFGICRVLYPDEFSSDSPTLLCCRTIPKGTMHYMDPEFTLTGELTKMSDVYSFGIVLLRLLTRRSSRGISKEVQYAIDTGTFRNLLDPTAGDWPLEQANQLASLALRCCEMSHKNRPDFATDIWKVLEPMTVSCGESLFGMSEDESYEIPLHFLCPIRKEVMRDPHIAADGYSYELEALREWLDSGHDTSPVTKTKLQHIEIVVNNSLRFAIDEWIH